MGLRDEFVDPDGMLTEADFQPDPRTVWSAIGTPMIDPDGTSDGAVRLTLRSSLTRVSTRHATVRELIDTAADEVQRHDDRDLAIMRAIGSVTRRTQPWTGLRPDSLVQLGVLLLDRRVATAAQLLVRANETGDDGPIARAMEQLGSALFLSDAVPFFVPSTIAAALMTSDPPDDALTSNIRLPFESVFVFFDAIPLGDLEFDGTIGDVNGATIDPSSASLVGAVVHAGPAGAGLDPVVHWALTSPTGDTHGVVLVAGVWQVSARPAVIANLAALCTWGEWYPPPPAPAQLEGEPDTRTWRRSLQRSAVRKAIGRGAVIGVHVVDVVALNASSARSESPPAGRSVRMHWRRGHGNSVRVATHDEEGNIVGDRLGVQGVDWHYEGRWIHPVVVHGSASDIVTVYAVPE